MFKNAYLNFFFSLITVVITAALCSWFNRIGMQNFYEQIQKSALTPPDIVFPIVWSVLYVLLVLAFDMVLNAENLPIRNQVWLFLGNMLLQILWCYVFFAQGWFMLGFVVLIILDFATAILIEQFYEVNHTAAYLLLPYMAWLLFATYLNWTVVALNGNTFIS